MTSPVCRPTRAYATLLETNLRAPQAFWSAPGSPLADAARAFLAGPGSVTAIDNRYLTVTGCVVDPAPDADTKPCSQRGLLWLDLGRAAPGQAPLLVFSRTSLDRARSRGSGRPPRPTRFGFFPITTLQASRSRLYCNRLWRISRRAPRRMSSPLPSSFRPTRLPRVVGAIETGITNHTCTTASH